MDGTLHFDLILTIAVLQLRAKLDVTLHWHLETKLSIHLVMCSQITYQLRNLSIKFHTENCREEISILSVLTSHEPNFTCRILENTNSFVFWVCLFLWMKLELPSLCNQSVPHSPGWPSGLLVVHSHLSVLFQSISKFYVNGKGPWFFFSFFSFSNFVM